MEGVVAINASLPFFIVDFFRKKHITNASTYIHAQLSRKASIFPQEAAETPRETAREKC
jgi:hypothetical protein